MVCPAEKYSGGENHRSGRYETHMKDAAKYCIPIRVYELDLFIVSLLHI